MLTGGMYKNEYAWNQYSNMLYLEAPIGVGFSYSNDNVYEMSDNTTADDNYYALLKFFELFTVSRLHFRFVYFLTQPHIFDS